MQQLETLTETSRIIPLRWRSLTFDTNGNSYRGKKTYDNQLTCLEVTKHAIEQVRTSEKGFLRTLDGIILAEDYSWHMAMPELV